MKLKNPFKKEKNNESKDDNNQVESKVIENDDKDPMQSTEVVLEENETKNISIESNEKDTKEKVEVQEETENDKKCTTIELEDLTNSNNIPMELSLNESDVKGEDKEEIVQEDNIPEDRNEENDTPEKDISPEEKPEDTNTNPADESKDGTESTSSMEVPDSFEDDIPSGAQELEEEKDKLNSMSREERVKLSQSLKKEGTDLFKQQKYKEASEIYRKASSTIHDLPKPTLDIVNLYTSCYSNAALCEYKLGNHEVCMGFCDLGLEKDSTNVKMYYRRGMSAMALKDYERAKKSLYMAYKLDENNKEVNQTLVNLKNILKAQKENEKKLFKGCFDKLDMYSEVNKEKKEQEKKRKTKRKGIV